MSTKLLAIAVLALTQVTPALAAEPNIECKSTFSFVMEGVEKSGPSATLEGIDLMVDSAPENKLISFAVGRDKTLRSSIHLSVKGQFASAAAGDITPQQTLVLKHSLLPLNLKIGKQQVSNITVECALAAQ